MDPVGPWSAYAASYNRLTTGSSSFQANSAVSGSDFVTAHHHLTATGNTSLGGHQPGGSIPSTTPQLLLQAAHSSANLAGQLGIPAAGPGTPSPFNPGGFLSPPPVGYDHVFTPLFHHANPKPAHYSSAINVTQHRQALAQVQAAAAAAVGKQASVDNELPIRENYNSAHHQSLPASSSSIFSHHSTASNIAWSHQNSAQLPSPFGILPHETTVTSSGPATCKSGSYESTFNTHFAAAHLNSQLNVAECNKSSNYSDHTHRKASRSQSPVSASTKSSSVTPSSNVSPNVTSGGSVSASGTNTFYHVPRTTYPNSETHNDCPTLDNTSFSVSKSHPSESQFSSGTSTKSYSNNNNNSNSVHQQPSCIVSTASSSKDYRIHSLPRTGTSSLYSSSSSITKTVTHNADKHSARSQQDFISPITKSHHIQNKTQSKVYSEVNSADNLPRNENLLESSQSSPISFAMMDSTNRQNLNFNGNVTNTNNSNKSSKLSSNTQHMTNSSSAQQPHFQHSSPFPRQYSNSSESDYHISGHIKSAPTESSFSSTTPHPQNGPDCGVSVPHRASPLQTHSQASPLGHVASPVYPMYNSPMTSMSSPSPLQHSDQSPSQCSSGATTRINCAPPSPLDVTVPRPSSQGTQSQVAYPSVITRALTNDNASKQYSATENRSYEHVQEYPQKQPCWDAAERHTHHSQPGNKFIPYGNGVDVSQVQQTQRMSGVPERQQTYFDSNTVNSQDLSSCRGDPMNMVKNLQPVHHPQSCNLQQPNVETQKEQIEEQNRHLAVKPSSGKRKKNLEKNHTGTAVNDSISSLGSELYVNRVPPPAHHNSPQQQNGGYFDFERWNIPPPPPKMFGGGPSTFCSQSSLHHNSGFVSSPAQQQSLMVPHPTPPPSLPYFPPFPLRAPHQNAHEFQPPNDTNSSSFESQNSSTKTENECNDDQPKVIVPNIEEELGFLSAGNSSASIQGSSKKKMEPKVPERKPFMANNPASGFMASYMKFLQGERDSSPPPQNRGRKTPWCTTKHYLPELSKTTSETTGFTNTVTSFNTVTTTTSQNAIATNTQINFTAKANETLEISSSENKNETGAPSYDPQDDPRYFPLPKNDASRRSFADSDDSDLEFEREKEQTKLKEKEHRSVQNSLHKSAINHKESAIRKTEEILNVINKQISLKNENKKRDLLPKLDSATAAAHVAAKVGLKPKHTSAKVTRGRRMCKVDPSSKSKRKPVLEEVDPLAIPPRRETSRRKAKERTSTIKFLEDELEDFDVDEPDLEDSDSDPAWTPAKDTSDEEGGNRRRSSRRSKNVSGRKRTKQPSANKEDEYSSDETSDRVLSKRYQPNHRASRGRPKTVLPISAPSVTKNSSIEVEANNESSDKMPFKSGEFVVMKSDLSAEYPPLWRVDGKTLLQKYEPFDKNGQTLYRNISTYSGWTPQNRHLYQEVPVKVKVQNRLETVVEFLRSEMILDDPEFIENSLKETQKYQDNFEVYIQTLISQALDSNFLTEILQEQDEYFLTNVKSIDDLTEDRIQRLLRATQWNTAVKNSVATWPCLNVISELPLDEKQGKLCSACDKLEVSVRIQMYGQPYNSTTLEGCQPDPKVAYQKDFVVCTLCAKRLELYNKVVHQKYLMFIECAKRVGEWRLIDPKKDTTHILNDLLADEAWLNELFLSVRTSWAHIEKFEHEAQVADEATVSSSSFQEDAESEKTLNDV